MNFDEQLDELMSLFEGLENSPSKAMKALGKAKEKLEFVYNKGFEDGLKLGLKKLEDESK